MSESPSQDNQQLPNLELFGEYIQKLQKKG